MPVNKKKMSILLYLLFIVSSISSIPTVAAASIESSLGHKFTEDYWSVLYDFAGAYLEEDYNPGPYSDDLSEGLTDNNTEVDSKFFIAYNNLENVQTLYIAMQNFTWEAANGSTTHYGCAPYQVLLQHFRPPGQTKIHIFVINTFLGLLAYREDATDPDKNDIPDEDDELYMGWGFYSEYHKAVANLLFALNSVPKDMRFDTSTRGTATSIPIQETSAKTYKYGMSYKNVFILWQKLNVTEGLDDTVTMVEIINKCSAFALLSEINFTFVVSYKDSAIEGLGEVTTTTEYDIGDLSNLWVVGDNQGVVNKFNGEYVALTKWVDTTLGYYTGNALVDRIDGDETTPGFSLSVVNHANVLLFDQDEPQEGFESGEFIDQDENTLGASTKNLTAAVYDWGDDPAYKIDFASKPTYVHNGVDIYDAPTRVLKNEAVETSVGGLQRLYVRTALAASIAEMSESPVAGLLAFFGEKLDEARFYYLTCFPVWSGGTIEQDPTFSVYVPAPTEDGGRRIPGYGPLLVFLIGLCGITLILYQIRKQKSLRIR